ncbi:hypothetical protein CLG96_12710 [Sphingomonas oleivorans]|uniref:Uncharacterized protein n=1 Tax=Sphingomonas oleivorans TaxID=1735121 RepID=A0A2T5FW45_9SPHN|nr:DUF5335 family protein [Sphingomonas oleivorans]PTQ10002.1 hypothetical protein CLG96_12710 [Sphingomonas oleivorans]
MAVRTLEKAEWQHYFDRVARALRARRATVELVSLPLGDQRLANRRPVIGISYEPRDGVLEIALEGIDHLIPRPQRIHVEEEALSLSSIEIVDHDGTREIVTFSDPLMLPPPESAHTAEQ